MFRIFYLLIYDLYKYDFMQHNDCPILEKYLILMFSNFYNIFFYLYIFFGTIGRTKTKTRRKKNYIEKEIPLASASKIR